MGFLKKFLQYGEICIQCHDNPDADTLAAAYGVMRYLQDNGVKTRIIYGGPEAIKKSALKTLVKECGIPAEFTDSIPEAGLLLMVDCQRGNGNAQKYPAREIAIIDHHPQNVEESENYLIRNYQSCSTIIWELLNEENYKIDEKLSVALLFGLYTDTSQYADLYAPRDTEMKMALYRDQPLFDRLCKSNMSVAELLVAGDALLHHYLDISRGIAIVEALRCDQSVLGAIGDIVICVDVVSLSITYTETADGYRISLRSSHETIKANEAAVFLCRDIGSGGGHANKAGGYLIKEKIREKYGDKKISSVILELLATYVDSKKEANA